LKEWYLDTSELEQAKAELDFDRKATRADEVYRLRFAFPVLLGMVVLTVTYFLPQTSISFARGSFHAFNRRIMRWCWRARRTPTALIWPIILRFGW
jgi:hypothetical protein